MNAKLKMPTYKMFPYELEFLKREISALTGHAPKIESHEILIENPSPHVMDILLKKSTYFKSLIVENKEIQTDQSLIECVRTEGRRQNTRYLSHGMHEYKGKFNPQVARSLLNIFKIKETDSLLDPFCGSGTTILEANRLGINAVGFDINPLAIFISKAKLLGISIDPLKIVPSIKKAIAYSQTTSVPLQDSERTEYLLFWIPKSTLEFLEKFKLFFNKHPHRNFYLALASNVIRDYSLQEPSDLRIRKRISEFPKTPISEALLMNAEEISKELSRNVKAVSYSSYEVKLQDIREKTNYENYFDIAITSPPYATALPYVDTYRISMVWLELIKQNEIKKIERELIGNREISKKQSREIWESQCNVARSVPKSIIDFCHKLHIKLTNSDGFRKQAVPSLLLRYFSDMQKALENINHSLKRKKKLCLIIGKNKTGIGGDVTIIDTPEFIKKIAISNGWKCLELFPLQAYQRFGLHFKNAITEESLLVLETK